MSYRNFGMSFFAGLLLMACADLSAIGYSGGNGLDTDPYLIASVGDWEDMMNTSTDWDKYFALTADLDFTGVTLSPVGTESNKFTGGLDGRSHAISNVLINQPVGSYVGLFGYVQLAEISNLRLENAQIIGQYWVGGVVGRVDASVISEVCFDGKVTGIAYVGGIAGVLDSEVARCSVSGDISGSRYVGGVAGYVWSSNIIDSYSLASVTGLVDSFNNTHESLGGLVGWSNSASSRFSNSYAAGKSNASARHFVCGWFVGQKRW
jgi:hypothetical protein